MKQIILIISFIFSLLIQRSDAQTYGWVDISGNIPPFPYDTTIINFGQDTIVAGLSDVFFINDNEGWITTSHPFNDTAAILHTTDGGASFTVQTTTLPCDAIWMLNANEGYAGGQSGFVYQTSNGGVTWNFHGPIANTLIDISFPPQPSDTGYACGFNGAIYSIYSSGVSAMTSGFFGDANSLSFPVSSTEGWVCGAGSIIRHYTGGAWVADQGNIGGYWSGIYFTDNLNGWVVGNLIKHTSNGKNWLDQTNPDTLGRTMLNVFFLNSNEGWIAGNLGLILQTTNGGTIWTVEANGLTDDLLTRVQFTSSTNGYVTGNNKTLLKYTQLASVDENEILPAIKVYPNPSSGNFQIEFTSTKNRQAKIEIINVLGEALKTETYHKGRPMNIAIDISDFPKGVYLIRLQTKDFIETKKVIITK